MLNAGEAMYAYRFEGYWKDVGTIDSLWESNMDLLDPNVPLELNDPEWRIYSRNPVMPPHYVAKGATIQNSLAAEGCNVYGTVGFLRAVRRRVRSPRRHGAGFHHHARRPH